MLPLGDDSQIITSGDEHPTGPTDMHLWVNCAGHETNVFSCDHGYIEDVETCSYLRLMCDRDDNSTCKIKTQTCVHIRH